MVAFAVAMLGLAFSRQSTAAASPASPTTRCALFIDATAVSPGETHTLVGSGFGPKQRVAITFADGARGGATTDAGGALTFTLHVPRALTGDSWRVVAASAATSCSLDTSVAAASRAQTPEPPSQSGFAFIGFREGAAIAGVFLAACALLFLTIGRRRRV